VFGAGVPMSLIAGPGKRGDSQWRRHRAAILLMTLMLATGIGAIPAVTEADEPGPYSDNMFGDWGGLRSKLYKDGVDIEVSYTSESATNVQGGAATLGRYTDQFVFGTTFDLQKILGLDNAKFQVTFTDRNGENLSDDAQLGTLQQVQEIY